MFETVAIATDGSESVVDATEVDASPEDLQSELRTALEESGKEALAAVRERSDREVVTHVREGRPAVEVCNYARENDVDVVVTGTRGRHGEHRFLLGSVAERVVRSCPVPVLSVRQLE
jgi:nucleotide-binding universal stress UspA family protein